MAEVAVILASHTPDWRVPRNILSWLVTKGSPERIQPSPLFFLGTTLATLGGYIRYRCYQELGQLYTFEMSIRKDHNLVKTGPYSIVRHPGYAGVLFTAMGMICLHGGSVRGII